jgi:hypothetical protein
VLREIIICMCWRSFDPAYGVRRPTTTSSAFSSSTMSSATTTSSEMSTSVPSSNEQSASTAVITVNSGVCHKVYHVLNILLIYLSSSIFNPAATRIWLKHY